MTETIAYRDLAGIVLAAGASARLGSPKQLVRLPDEPLVCRAARLAAAQCGAGVVVVTGAHRAEVEQAVAGLAVRCVDNPGHADGQAGSLCAGLAALPGEAAAALILTCDQYRVGPAELLGLARAWRADPGAAAVAAYAGTVGVPVIVPRGLWPEVASLAGDRGAGGLLRRAARRVEVAMPSAAFDIDTPQDLARARLYYGQKEH